MGRRIEDELLAQATTLRALARDLVGTDAADDLVQDSALQALRARPRSGGSLLGLVTAIVRHLGSKHRRSERRRLAREQGAARAEALPPTDSAVMQRETLSRLTNALLALPEPYRSALLQRYYENKMPAAIAAQTGEPVATIKSRLQRGLALLRADLERNGTADDWRGALVTAFGLERADKVAATIAATTGVLWMTTTMKVLLGGGAAAAVAVAAMFTFAGEPGDAQIAATTAGTGTEVAVARSTEPAPAVDAQRVAEPVAPAVSATLATIRGRCVDAHGNPVAGASATVNGWGGNTGRIEAWTRNHALPENIHLTVTTSDDGAFALQFEPLAPLQYSLDLRAPGCAQMTARWFELPPAAVRDVGDVAMPRGTRIFGSVLDSEGRPVADHRLEFQPATGLRFPGEGAMQGEEYAVTQSGADGSFACNYSLLIPGDYVVRAGGRAVSTPKVIAIAAPGEQRVDVTLTVASPDNGPAIAGIVVDDRGLCVPSAQIKIGYCFGRHAAVTDRAGRFRFTRKAEDPDTTALYIDHPWFEVLTTDTEFAWGREDVQIVLPRGLEVAVRAIDNDGAPVENYQLRVLPRQAQSSRDIEVRASGNHVDGRAVAAGLRRGSYFVVVEPAGEALAISPFVPVEVVDGMSREVTVRVARFGERAVHVVRADGSPAAGVTVALVDPLGRDVTPRLMLRAISDLVLLPVLPMALQIATATTDANGVARLRGPNGRELALVLPGPGHPPMALADFSLDEGSPFEVSLAEGARFSGHLVPSEVVAELLTSASDRPGDQLVGIRLVRGERLDIDYFPIAKSAPIGADGAFTFLGVPSGSWRICAEIEGTKLGLRMASNEPIGTVDLTDATATEMDIDVAFLAQGDLDATVLHNDAPLAGTNVLLERRLGRDAGGRVGFDSTKIVTDSAGSIRCRIRAGEYRVSCWSTAFVWVHSDEHVLVTAGSTVTQTFHLRAESVRLRLLDDRGQPAAGVALALVDGNGDSQQPDRTAADGTTKAWLPPGTYTASVLPKRLCSEAALQKLLRDHAGATLASLRIPISTVVVAIGQPVDRQLLLPAAWSQ